MWKTGTRRARRGGYSTGGGHGPGRSDAGLCGKPLQETRCGGMEHCLLRGHDRADRPGPGLLSGQPGARMADWHRRSGSSHRTAASPHAADAAFLQPAVGCRPRTSPVIAHDHDAVGSARPQARSSRQRPKRTDHGRWVAGHGGGLCPGRSPGVINDLRHIRADRDCGRHCRPPGSPGTRGIRRH